MSTSSRHRLNTAIGTAADRASDPGGLRFTERQLYYETCRVLDPTPPFLRRAAGPPRPVLRLPAFTRALDARGRETLPGLLPAAMPPAAVKPPKDPAEPDLYDYGLPRLLLCQDPSIAAMLLANHVHLEAACPILAVPETLPPPLLGALERADGATVHVLHDASPEGVALPARIRAALGPDAPSTGVRVSSLGLVPRHASALQLPSGRGPAPSPAAGADWPAALRPREAAWLARGRFAEVAAVPPAKLVRAVLRLPRGPRPPRDSVWGELSGLRSAGFMTWPAA